MSRLASIAKKGVPFVLAIAVGLGSAGWSVKHTPASANNVQVGVWHIKMLTGSSNADDLTRARVAIGGLLALDRSESMYFVAHNDSQLRPLRSHCTYKVSDTAPAARWWSITAYADDHFLFDAPDKKFSFTSNGDFSFITGPHEITGRGWLPTPGDRGLELILRLYQPDATLQTSPALLRAPDIEQMGACA